MFTESLLAASLTFTAWHGDTESTDQRQARLAMIAQAVDIATLHAVCDENAPQFPALDPYIPRVPSQRSEGPAGGSGTRKEPGSQEGADSEEESAEETPACRPLWRGNAKNLAFLLLTQAYYETRLAAHIHEGKCRVNQGECDGGKAISLWQLQFGPHLPKEHWRKLSGHSLEATTLAAFEAARSLSRGRNQCRSLEGAVSLYATGSTCNWKPAEKRVGFMLRLRQRY